MTTHLQRPSRVTRAFKPAALTEANRHSGVLREIDAYVCLRDTNNPVLAPGHQLSQTARARRLRRDSLALRRQAEHQIKRSRNISTAVIPTVNGGVDCP